MARFSYGGQALIEGVMMRGRDAIAVALRHPDGRIVFETERLNSGVHGFKGAKWPFVRGLVILYETLVVGTRWLIRSAGLQAAEEGVEIGKSAVALMLLFTAVLGIGLFFILPLIVATFTAGNIENSLVQHIVEGLTRIVIFFAYLAVIARTPDVKRVFAYHGAEHMTIHALEAGDTLRPEAIRKYPTAHPRCGTEFLVVVILLSILAFSLVGRQPPLVMILSRILLIPVIASVGYELLRVGARHRSNPIVKVVMWPGILVQMITTKQPTDDMIEVAIVSIEEALRADGEAVPEGGLGLARDPMPKPGRDGGTGPRHAGAGRRDRRRQHGRRRDRCRSDPCRRDGGRRDSHPGPGSPRRRDRRSARPAGRGLSPTPGTTSRCPTSQASTPSSRPSPASTTRSRRSSPRPRSTPIPTSSGPWAASWLASNRSSPHTAS